MKKKNEIIDKIKRNISINRILDIFNIKHPERDSYLISCPWKTDRHPSFSVFVDSRGIQHWKYYSENISGDVVDLYMKLQNCNLRQAIYQLSNNFTFSTVTELNYEENQKESKIKVDKVLDFIESTALHQHLRVERGFPEPLYKEWLNEIQFHVESDDYKSSQRYGFGIPSDNGKNYQIRTCFKYNRNGKECQNKWSTGQGITIFLTSFCRLIIFEAMCDFLAYLAMFPKTQASFIILNSVHNWKKAVDYLNSLEWKFVDIGVCLDNDKSGREVTEKILEALNDYPYKFAEMSKQWLEENPEASEWEKRCYERSAKYGNKDLVPVVWSRYKGIKGCKDLSEIWQRLIHRDWGLKQRFKSCEICRYRGFCKTPRGMWQISANVCKSFWRLPDV